MSWPRPAGAPPCRWSPCLVDGPGRRQRLLGQLVFDNLCLQRLLPRSLPTITWSGRGDGAVQAGTEPLPLFKPMTPSVCARDRKD